MPIKENIQEVLSCIKSNQTIMVGGFGLVGAPLTLIDGLINMNINNLTIVSNNLGEQGIGLGKLLNQNKIKRAIGSYFTSNKDAGVKFKNNEILLDLLPQGTLSEAIRAGGAGLGGFYTKTGVGTLIAEGKETKQINGETYLFEKSIYADVALIKGYKADTLGNIIYYKTARNFNPIMASAAKKVIVEVDEIVEAGELNPENIITPHLFVDSIIKSGNGRSN